MDPARPYGPKDRLSLEAAGYTRIRAGIKRFAAPACIRQLHQPSDGTVWTVFAPARTLSRFHGRGRFSLWADAETGGWSMRRFVLVMAGLALVAVLPAQGEEPRRLYGAWLQTAPAWSVTPANPWTVMIFNADGTIRRSTSL